MKTAVIITDHAPFPERVASLMRCHPDVRSVTPWHKPNAHSTPIRAPMEWLPEEPMPLWKKEHYKADAMNLTAVATLGLDADFYWFIESDVCASEDRWRALFEDWENDATDCVGNALRTRQGHPRNAWWNHPATPPWASTYFIMAVYRLSRAAVAEGIRCAVEMRNTFSEVTVSNVCLRAGLTTASVNARQTHWNVQTFKTHDWKVKFNPLLVNHPVKSNMVPVASTQSDLVFSHTNLIKNRHATNSPTA